MTKMIYTVFFVQFSSTFKIAKMKRVNKQKAKKRSRIEWQNGENVKNIG